MKKTILLMLLLLSIGTIAACSSTSDMTDKELSQNYCEGCHGDDLKGRGLSEKEILSSIKKGTSGMNADILKGADAKRAAAYWAAKQ